MNPHEVFFTSDTHFGHEAILQHDKSAWWRAGVEGFANIEAHDEYIIGRWNEVVRDCDTVYHLGDFAFRCAKPVHEYRSRLNGRIVLIPGNHDPGFAFGKAGLWQRANLGDRGADIGDNDEVRTALSIVKILGQRIVLCHYPLLRWEGCHQGWWHLFGHVHGNVLGKPGSLDVGFNVHGRPLSYGEIAWKLRDFKALPHHPHTGVEDAKAEVETSTQETIFL